MTVNDAQPLIGKSATWDHDGIPTPVTIRNVRSVFGRTEYEVQPFPRIRDWPGDALVEDSPLRWVAADKVSVK